MAKAKTDNDDISTKDNNTDGKTSNEVAREKEAPEAAEADAEPKKSNTEIAMESLYVERQPPSQKVGSDARDVDTSKPYQPIKSDLPVQMQGERSVASMLNPELTDPNHRNAAITHPDWAPGRLPDGVTVNSGNPGDAVAIDVPVNNPGDKDGGAPLARNEPGEH